MPPMRVAPWLVAFVLLGSMACSDDARAPFAVGVAAETSAFPAEVTVATKFLGSWDCYPHAPPSPGENSPETVPAVAGVRLLLEKETAMSVCTRPREAPCETKSLVQFRLTAASRPERSGYIVVQPEGPAVLWSGNFFPIDAPVVKGESSAPRATQRLPFRANETGDVIESFSVVDLAGTLFPVSGTTLCLPHVSH